MDSGKWKQGERRGEGKEEETGVAQGVLWEGKVERRLNG